MSKKKKTTVVRMLAQVVHILYRPICAGMSGIEPDKSELDTRKLLLKLQKLTRKDPKNEFDTCFVRLQLKLLKRMRIGR